MIHDINRDAFPPEIELSRAVDRLAREPERVGDWSMVLEAFAKVDELKTGAQLMHLGAEIRKRNAV